MPILGTVDRISFFTRNILWPRKLSFASLAKRRPAADEWTAMRQLRHTPPLIIRRIYVAPNEPCVNSLDVAVRRSEAPLDLQPIFQTRCMQAGGSFVCGGKVRDL